MVIKWKRDWCFYSTSSICDELSKINWDINVVDVQQYWNVFENMLIEVVDKLAPLTKFYYNEVLISHSPQKSKQC
jgi:hypothetical protein